MSCQLKSLKSLLRQKIIVMESCYYQEFVLSLQKHDKIRKKK